MTHAVSLTYSRFDHMSPTAVALAALLHVSVFAALLLVSPLKPVDTTPDAIDITMEAPPAPVETPPPAEAAPAPPAPPPMAAAPAPAPTPAAPPMRLGITPFGTNQDPKAAPGSPQPETPKPQTPAEEAAKPEPPKAEVPPPEPPKPETPPETRQALAQPATPPPPPPPPQPTLESALPPIDAPPPPVSAREIPKPPPPQPPAPQAPPPAQARVQPAPPPTRPPLNPGLQSSPLSTAPSARAPADQQAARQAPNFTNPADAFGQKRAEDEYLWYVARKLSQHQQYVRNTSTESGTVVLRLVIARDGRLVDVSLSRSSGSPNLDATTLAMVRGASPYPPLPESLSGAQHAFILPLYFKRN